MSVCLSARLHTSKTICPNFYKIFCKCYIWPWLGPPLMIMQYVMYFRSGFVADVRISHNGAKVKHDAMFRLVRQVAVPEPEAKSDVYNCLVSVL